MTEPDAGAKTQTAPLRRFHRRLAHDITGNVGVVMNALAEALREEETEEMRTRFRQMAERGLRRLERIAELVRLGVELEESQANEASPVALGLVLTDALARARGLEARRGIEIEEAPVPAVEVVVDQRLLRVLLRELLSNAIAHAKTSVKLRAVVEGRLVHIEVEDDGNGFSSSDVGACSKPEKPRGLGVALGLAAEIAARQGGELSIRGASAEPSRLSCVRASIPLR